MKKVMPLIAAVAMVLTMAFAGYTAFAVPYEKGSAPQVEKEKQETTLPSKDGATDTGCCPMMAKADKATCSTCPMMAKGDKTAGSTCPMMMAKGDKTAGSTCPMKGKTANACCAAKTTEKTQK